MEAKRFISKVLPDGHLSLPEDTAKNIGQLFEVILFPLEETDIYSYTEILAKEKGFSMKSRAPAVITDSGEYSLVYPVITMMGRFGYRLKSVFVRVTPSISGIAMSVITASHLFW